MPNTPNYGFPFPSLSDVPNVPADMEALAEAIDTELTTRPEWQIAARNFGTIAGNGEITETVTGFPEMADALYAITHMFYDCDAGPFTLRLDTSSLTTTSFTVDIRNHSTNARTCNVRFMLFGRKA